MERLKKLNKSYAVAISIPLEPPREDTHTAAEAIAKLVQEGYEGDSEVLAGKYPVSMMPITPERLPELEEFKENCDTGVERNMFGRGEAAFQFIGARAPSDFIEERVASVIQTLKSAYGQLEDGIPNIIYVDFNISTMTPDRADAMLQKLPAAIEKKLERDYSKISAVVLTDLKVLGDSEISGFRANEEVIRNPRAKNPLPESFLVYGDRKSGKCIVEDIDELLS